MIPKVTQRMINEKGVIYWSCEELMSYIGKTFQFDENGNYMLDPETSYTEDEVIAIQNTVLKNGKRILRN